MRPEESLAPGQPAARDRQQHEAQRRTARWLSRLSLAVRRLIILRDRGGRLTAPSLKSRLIADQLANMSRGITLCRPSQAQWRSVELSRHQSRQRCLGSSAWSQALQTGREQSLGAHRHGEAQAVAPGGPDGLSSNPHGTTNQQLASASSTARPSICRAGRLRPGNVEPISRVAPRSGSPRRARS